MIDPEDDRLVTRYLAGDTGAFNLLYDRYRVRIYGYILRNCRNRDTADELFQDVWARVITNLDRYQHRGRFRQWLTTCAHNVIVDYFRRNQPETSQDPEIAVPGSDAENEELREHIEAAMMKLPFEQRQAVYLREILCCSLADIAEVQGCGFEAAKSRLRYAYEKLRNELAEQSPARVMP